MDSRHKNTTHGHCSRIRGKSPTYRSWKAMHDRFRKSHAAYGRYAGRGIEIHGPWKTFENFLMDMGERPEGTTLDRIDNNGNYEPGNCRWATRSEQQSNMRSNVKLRCYSGPKGEKTMAEWSRISGTPIGTIFSRLKRRPDLTHKQVVFGGFRKRSKWDSALAA